MNWKFPTFAFGSVILTFTPIGASAGAHAELSGSTSTVAFSGAQQSSDTSAVPAVSNNVGEFEFVSPEVIERARQRIRARALLERRSGGAQVRPSAGSAVETSQYPTPVAAKLPLPNALIARTIERIGYSCGAVASETALEGDEPGMFKVTCTSGQSYQARPVHGLYHFRRW